MLQNNDNIIQKAVAALKKGQLVALPTETVYGLCADALNEKAIARLRQVKDREKTQPISILIAKMDDMTIWARDIPPIAYTLAKQYWPGPLTLVLKQKNVSDSLTGGTDTIGLRVPNHPLTLEIIRQLGHGVAAPSANFKGGANPVSVKDLEVLGELVDFIVDGGPCLVGEGSTIIDVTQTTPKVLRQGCVDRGRTPLMLLNRPRSKPPL